MTDLTDAADSETSGKIANYAGQINRLDGLSRAFGRSISGAFTSGVVEGRRFEDVLKSIGQRFVEFGLKAAFKPVENALSGLFGSVTNAVGGGAASFGQGGLSGLFSGGGAAATVQPFADGGVIASPSYFPLRGGLGLAGERGAEAIMPLARGADGRLGVVAGQGGARAPSITVTVNATDVESFRGSEGQIAAALARAVSRGQRGL